MLLSLPNAYSEEIQPKNSLVNPINSTTHVHEIAYFPSPLKQIKMGVNATSVTCTEGLELVLKKSDGAPACIKPISVSKLLDLGWAIHILPDYNKNENNNSEVFPLGNYTVKTSNVQYSQNSQGYLAQPDIEGTFPAIVMIHEFWGLNDNIKDMALNLASQGYVVLAVDLYEGKVATTSEEARTLMTSFEQQQLTDNLNSAVDYLKSLNVDSIGSIGWCFGGGQSLQLAINNSDIDATVIYYGRLVTEPSLLSNITWPVLGIFAGNDTGIPVENVHQFESALKDLDIENQIIIYPGVGHAFANPSGDRYAPEESKDAWDKTLLFFEKNL
jgi:carboxymethylenebutenolidase